MKLRSIVWLLASLFVFLTPAVRAQTSGNPTTTQGSPHDQYTASISGTVFDPDAASVHAAIISGLQKNEFDPSIRLEWSNGGYPARNGR